jgi:DNA modification methylase
LVWNEQTGNLVGGHQRLKVLKEQGAKDIEVSVVDLKPSREKALNLALNKAQGDWDLPKLKDLLQELDTGEFDIGITGFDEKEIEDLMNQLYVPDENEKDDDVPEVPDEPVTKKGDLYRLGEHRLLCGDAIVIDDVERLMDGQKVDMVFTDPPYSVNYEKKNRDVLKSKSYSKITNDDLSVQDIAKDLWKPSFDNMALYSKDGASIYVTMPQGGDQMMMMMMMMMDSWQVKHELIWVKSSPVFSMGRLDYDYMHEPIIYGWKKNHQFYGNGEHKKSVWFIDRDGNKSHPTMKPVALMGNAINNSSKMEDNILDLFGGSGSTLIACEKLNRKCYMMELDEHYCDVIVKRWEDYTGKKAELMIDDKV